MELSKLSPAEGSKHSQNFRRGRGHGSGMVRQQVRDTRVRRLVPEHQESVSGWTDALIPSYS